MKPETREFIERFAPTKKPLRRPAKRFIGDTRESERYGGPEAESRRSGTAYQIHEEGAKFKELRGRASSSIHTTEEPEYLSGVAQKEKPIPEKEHSHRERRAVKTRHAEKVLPPKYPRESEEARFFSSEVREINKIRRRR